MTKKQRSYTDEFRREAVQLMETSGKPVAQIARDLGVNDNVLYRWRRRFGNQSAALAEEQGMSVNVLEAELRQVRQELEVVKQERDILKKAINIVSRSQP